MQLSATGAVIALPIHLLMASGKLMDSLPALERAGLEPIALAAKDGLGLLNGTQVSTALALKGSPKKLNPANKS